MSFRSRRVARTTGYLLFMLHLNACAYFVASMHQGLASTTWVYDGNGTAYVQSLLFAAAAVRKVGDKKLPQATNNTRVHLDFILSRASKLPDKTRQKFKVKCKMKLY